MADDGTQVGRAYIEVTPKIRMGAAQADLKRHLRQMAQEIDRELNRAQREVTGGFNRAMREFQKGNTKHVFAEHRAEMEAFQKLQKQKNAALDAERKKKDAISKAEIKAYEIERKRREVIQRAEVQAYIEAERRKIADRLKMERYIRARYAGATPEMAAGVASGALPSNVAAQYSRMSLAAQRAGSQMSRAMEAASHSMSQLSTRIGLASFQLQLLGGFATTFLTGPAAYGFFTLARDGLKFATSIDYARASMKALLGPTADVETIIRDLTQLAIRSPLFATEDAVGYAQKLAAVGVKGKDLTRTLEALGNIFLTGGVAGPERAQLALMAYTQILSKGSIGMDDLRQQLAEHLPNAFHVFKEAANILGYKDIPALNKAMKEGKVSSEELNEAFIKLGNSPVYLEGATAAAQTLGGVWQSFVEEMRSHVGMAFDANREAIIAAINGLRPVVFGLIKEFIRALPSIIAWITQLIKKAQEIKAAYDRLNPAQQELVRQTVLLALAAGPAAIAMGILGTAVSGIFNAISLGLKAVSLVAGVLGAVTMWLNVVVLGVLALTAVLGVFAHKNESVKNAIYKVLNFMKDFLEKFFLPVIDHLIGSIQSLEKTFGFLGLKSEHLAYVLAVLLVPVMAIAVAIEILIGIIKVLQAAILVVSAILYGLVHTVSYVLGAWQKLAEALGHLPGEAGEKYRALAKDIQGVRDSMTGWVDVSGQWAGLTESNSNATEGWRKKLAETDFTMTGALGAFDLWNGRTDVAITKQLTLEQAIDNARRAMELQNNVAAGSIDAADNYNKALLALQGSIKTNKKTLDEKTEAGQQNRDMLKRAAQASYEMMLQDIRSGVPMAEAIKRHKDRTAALEGEFGKNKETKKAAKELIDTYGKVPKNVRTLLETMGYPDVNAKMLDLLAKQRAGKNGTTVQYEKNRQKRLDGQGAYAQGGLVRGQGGTTADKVRALLSRREFVVNADSTNKVGVGVLEYINKYGQLPLYPQFAKGGLVQNWPFPITVKDFQIPELIGGSGSQGALGVARMMSILRNRFPGLPLLSGLRPGAITSTGNRSYHALGRAVDLPPRMDVFNWISSNWGKGTKELIYTPAGRRQIKNGQPHTFSGGTIAQDHYDHVHWAYDGGGYIPPNTPFVNKTGAHELALNASQAKALETKIQNSDRPVYVDVYVDGVRRDAEVVFNEKIDELIQGLGGA